MVRDLDEPEAVRVRRYQTFAQQTYGVRPGAGHGSGCPPTGNPRNKEHPPFLWARPWRRRFADSRSGMPPLRRQRPSLRPGERPAIRLSLCPWGCR